MACGTTSNIFIVDITQKQCVFNVLPVDLVTNQYIGRQISVLPSNSAQTPMSPKARVRSMTSADEQLKAEDQSSSRNSEQVRWNYLQLVLPFLS